MPLGKQKAPMAFPYIQIAMTESIKNMPQPRLSVFSTVLVIQKVFAFYQKFNLLLPCTMRYHVLIIGLALGVFGSQSGNGVGPDGNTNQMPESARLLLTDLQTDTECMRLATTAEKAAYPDRIWFSGMENKPAGNDTGHYGLTNDFGATAAYWNFLPANGTITALNGTITALNGTLAAPEARGEAAGLDKRFPGSVKLYYGWGCAGYGTPMERLASNLCYGNWGAGRISSIYIPSMGFNDWINFYEDKSCQAYVSQVYHWSGCLEVNFNSFYGCTRCR